MESCLAQSCAAAAGGSSGMLFAQLIQTLLVAQCSLGNGADYPPDRTAEVSSKPDDEYDFVIVGGGSAGSVVASRLSENKNWKVLLVEAGNDPSPLSDVPAMLLVLQGTAEDYAYEVEPDEGFCRGMRGKRCKWSKGKALGGSSAINAMLHIRGNDRDYDQWAEIGNPGWSFEEVLPYFKKSENYPPEILAKHGTKHFGTGGPLNVRTFNYSDSRMHEIIINAVKERGLPTMDVLNGDKVIGFGNAHGTLDMGVRVSAAKAFLSPAKNRKNLYVMKSARAEKIIMEGNRARGVRVSLPGGRTLDVKASKEVILSAGSISTPQLLMLSGVGPKSHLEEFGIEAVADLPVGKNLQDHMIWLGIQLEFVNETSPPFSPSMLLDAAYNYLVYKKGDLSATGGIDLLGFLNVNDPDSKYPDVEFHHVFQPRGHLFKSEAMMKAFDMEDDLTEALSKLTLESDAIFMCPVVLRPKSVGEVKLRSADPADPVKIYANYLADKSDVETFMKSVEFVKTLLDTETFKKLGIKLRHFPIPGCSATVPDSREYWECSLRHTAGTVYHPVGTARMGPADDPAAVVDAKLKVHGIKGLRVIDASIMPNIPSGNTNSPTLMVAEKGSDMIKKEWSSKDEL